MPNDQKEQAKKFQAEALKAAEQAEREKRKLAQQHFEASKLDVKPAPGKIGIPAVEASSVKVGQRDTSLSFDKPKQGMVVRDDKNDFISQDNKVHRFGEFNVPKSRAPSTKVVFPRVVKFIPDDDKKSKAAAELGGGAGLGIRASLVDGVQWAFDQLTIGSRILREDVTQFPSKGLEDFSKKLEKFSVDVSGKLGKVSENYRKQYLDKTPGLSGPAEYAGTIAGGFVSLGEALGVFAATKSPWAATALLTSLDTTGDYKAAIDSGMTHDQALGVYAASSAGTFILERIGWGFLFGEFGAKVMSRAAIIAIGTSGETATELAQTYWQNLIAKYTYDKSRKIFEGTWETIVATVPVGGVASGTHIYLDPKTNYNVARNSAIHDLKNSGMSNIEAQKAFDEMLSFAVQTKNDLEKAITRKTEGLTEEEKRVIQDVETKQAMAKGEKPVVYQEIEDQLFGAKEKSEAVIEKSKEEKFGLPGEREAFSQTIEREVAQKDRKTTLESFEEKRQEAQVIEFTPETPRDILISEKAKEIRPFLRFAEGLDLPSARNKAAKIIRNFEQPINKTQEKKKAQAEKFLELFSDVTLNIEGQDVDQIFEEVLEKASTPKEKAEKGIKTYALDIETQQEIGKRATPKAAPVGIPHNVIGSNKITIGERDFIKDAFRRWAKGYRAGSRETKVALRTLKDNFAELVKRLPTEKRGKFGKTIAKLETPKGLERAMERLLKELEVVKREAVVADIEKIAKKVKKAKKGGLINVEELKLLQDMFDGIQFKKPTQKTLDRLHKMNDFIQKQPDDIFIKPQLKKQLDRLSKKPLSEFSRQDLEDFRNTALKLLEQGEMKLYMKNIKQAVQFRTDLQILLSDLRPLKPDKVGFQNMTTFSRDFERINVFTGAPILTKNPEVFFKLDGFKEGMHSLLGKEMYWAYNDYLVANKEDQTKVGEAFVKVGFKDWSDAKIIDTAIHGYLMQDGHSQYESLMEVYHPDGALPKLEDDQKELLGAIREVFNDRADLYGFTFENMEGQIFPKLLNYLFPFKYHRGRNAITPENDVAVIDDYNLRQTIKKKKIEAGNAIARLEEVKNLMPRTDLMNMVFEGLEERNASIYVEPKLRHMRKLFDSKEYQSNIDDLTRSWIDDYISSLARRGHPSDYNAVIEWFRRQTSISLMSFKPTTILVQLTAIVDAFVYTYVKKDLKTAMLIPYEFSKSWLSVPLLDRYVNSVKESSTGINLRKGGDFFMEELYNERYLGTGTGMRSGKLSRMRRAWGSIGMKPTQWTDIHTAAPVQRALAKSFMKSGLNEKQANEEADYIMDIVSGSSNVAIRPVAFSGSSMGRALLQIKTFQLSRWDTISKNLIEQGLIHGDLNTKAKSVIGLMIMMPNFALEVAIRNWYILLLGALFGVDREDKKLTTQQLVLLGVSGPIRELPFLGSAITGAILGFETGVLDTPISGQVDRFTNAAQSFITSENEDVKSRALAMMAESIAIMNGMPAGSLTFDMVEAYMEGGEDFEKKLEKMLKENRSKENQFKPQKPPHLQGTSTSGLPPHLRK